MTKARTLGNFVSAGNPLADGSIAASEVTGLSTVATTGAYADLSGKPSLATVATSGAYADLSGKPSLATVATSGSYNDLSDKPTITATANDLSGGAIGSIPYQAGSGDTAMLAAGTAGQVLTSAGSGAAPTWTTVSSSAIGDVVYSTQAPSASWLLCDGSIYSKSSYSTLATKLGSLSDPYAGTWGNQQAGYPNFVFHWQYSGTWYSLSSATYSSQYGIYTRTGFGGATVSTTLSLTTWSAPTQGCLWGTSIIMGDYYGQTRLVAAPYTSLGTDGTGENWGNNRSINGLISNGSSIALHYGNYGDYCGTYLRRLYRTTNGYTWSNVTGNLPSWDGNSNGTIKDGVYASGIFLIGLQTQNGNSNNTYLAISSDGSSWTDVSIGGYGDVYSINYSAGYFWIVTRDGSGKQRILRSSNGSSWTVVWNENSFTGANINNAYTYNAVITGDSTGLIAMMYGNQYYLSTNLGTSWSAKTSPLASQNNGGFIKPDRGGLNGNTVLSFNSTSAPAYSSFTGTLYSYDPTTQFKMPTYSTLSTLSGTYAAPVYAYMKAA